MKETTKSEPTNIGLSEDAHVKLKRLQEDGHFAQMADAYRFAIALALNMGVTPPDLPGTRANIFGVATIDPEREIFTAIASLLNTGDEPIYRLAERLADFGVQELFRRAESGKLDISTILLEADRRVAA